jgi:hypothetical protein
MIKIGKIDKLLLLPISGGLIFIPFTIIIKYTEVKNHSIILSLCSSLGMMLSLIPLLISRINMKRAMSNKKITHKIKKNRNKNEIPLIYNKNNSEIKAHKFIYIFFSSLADLIQTIIETTIFNYQIKVNFWILDLLFLAIISYLLLRIKLYRHQYFSMIIIIILGLGLNIIEYFKKDKNDNNKVDPIEIIFKIISEICFCLNVVTNKLNMEKYFCNSYEICIWEGLIDLIVISFILLIINIIGVTISGINYPQNFYEYIDQFDISDLFLVLLTIIINGLYNIFIIATCDIFTPFHVLITLIINECYNYFHLK